MRSLLLLWPKPPAIKPPFALNRKGDRLGGKVTSSHNGTTTDIHSAVPVKNTPCGAKRDTAVGEWETVGWRERERKSDKSAAHERRRCVIYVSSERSGNWE